MTKQTEALRMAIEIMERLHQPNGNSVQLAIQACKEALAETQEATEQAPCDKPPSREWVGLSDAEITHIGISCQSLHQVARAIEAKLRDKNEK